MELNNNFRSLLDKHTTYLVNVLYKDLTVDAIRNEASNNNVLAKLFCDEADKIVTNVYNEKQELIEFLSNKTNFDNTDIEYTEESVDTEDIVKKDILLSYSYVIFAFINALMLSEDNAKDLVYLNFTKELIEKFSNNVNNTHIYNLKQFNITYIKSQFYWRLSNCWEFSGKPYEFECIEAKKKSNYYILQSGDCKPIATAYSFRKCTTFLYQALINEKLNLSSPYQFNDPMDCPIKDIVNETSKKAFKDCVKIACFIKGDEYNNLLMWPHYADSHKGICIKYNFSSFDLSQINNDKSQKVAFFKDIEYNNDKLKNVFSAKKPEEGTSINDAFFLKSEAWKYENELRLLYYDVNGKGDYATIDAPNCIEAIYFGYKCSDEDKKTIHKILKDKTVKIKDENGNFKSENIKFYQMEIDKDNFGQIKAVDYNPD